MFSAGVALLLWGCPGYGDHDDCVRDAQCAPGYVCDADAGRCVQNTIVSCDEPSDCLATATCAMDGTCQAGDCSWPDIGCVEGYECTADEGLWACRASAGDEAAGGVGGASTMSGGPGGSAGAT